MLGSVLKWYAITAVVIAVQFAVVTIVRNPPRAVGIPIAILLFFAGGCVIFFAGNESTRFVVSTSGGELDLARLFTTTWVMLLAFAPCWFLINTFFVSGINIAQSKNIGALITMWVAASLFAPPIILLLRDARAFIAQQSALHWTGYVLGLGMLLCLMIAEMAKK